MGPIKTKIKFKADSGFTLIEILVVVAILALLASVALVAFNNARIKARDAQRRANLAQLRKALETYYNVNNSYPKTTNKTNPASFVDAIDWLGESDNGGDNGYTGAGGYIPNLAPTYVAKLPGDSLRNQAVGGCTAGEAGYWYISNGKDFKLKARCLDEEYPVATNDIFYDPGGRISTFVVYSPGAANW